MAGKRDKYGHLVDPAERYQEFMLQVYDLWSLAEEYGYSKEARDILNQARLVFMDEFQARHPDFASGRAKWR
ncbi:hypothetical protein EOW77_0017655 [Bradyrhizobium yuanmingense]|uniref:hypothetical protein n=1 Tax=Bradyrhizobium yuanmingense TaxID=108015 RepID=UPI000FE38839|nr:hypothetical protein [Bradyrhizobium yuanmingense]TGN86451.1 hypothetical protein EOW77_0017655 [Bradyrhizobium yuanmingense]